MNTTNEQFDIGETWKIFEYALKLIDDACPKPDGRVADCEKYRMLHTGAVMLYYAWRLARRAAECGRDETQIAAILQFGEACDVIDVPAAYCESCNGPHPAAYEHGNVTSEEDKYAPVTTRTLKRLGALGITRLDLDNAHGYDQTRLKIKQKALDRKWIGANSTEF